MSSNAPSDKSEDSHNKGEQDASNGVYDPPDRPNALDLLMNSIEVNDRMWDNVESYKQGHKNTEDQKKER
jgi:hypothetical protein